jgi:hypothetical protein
MFSSSAGDRLFVSCVVNDKRFIRGDKRLKISIVCASLVSALLNFRIVPVRYAPGLVSALETAVPIRVRTFPKVPCAHYWGLACALDR